MPPTCELRMKRLFIALDSPQDRSMHASSILFIAISLALLFDHCYAKTQSTDGVGDGRPDKLEDSSQSEISTISLTFNTATRQKEESHKSKENSGRDRKMDGNVKSVENFVSDLKQKLEFNTCLPGLRVEKKTEKKNLVLSRGKLLGLDSLYYINGGRILAESQGNVEFEMLLAFENLRVEYYYEYNSTPFFTPKKKEGLAVFQLKGITSVSAVAVASRIALSSSTPGQKCFFGVVRLGINEMPHRLNVIKINSSMFTRTLYPLMRFVSPTARGVTSIVNTVQGQIKKDVEDALIDVLGSLMRREKSVCSIELSWKPRDCSYINDMIAWD